METAEKPQISILMAVYDPRLDWLKEQLVSLNEQTYPNLHLYVRDDASPTVPFGKIEELTAECITSFPYTVRRNETNLGSNGTFALLTQEAEGSCFAYCDQDDIWLPEKLAVMQEALQREKACLVCSDMYIIDGNGDRIADSITEIRRHHIFRSGEGLADTLWYFNFASGCALLVRADLAKKALPWNPYMYYDHFITFFCANEGKIISLPQPLILHREHGTNQSSLMNGVHDRESYRRIRVDQKASAILWLKENFVCREPLKSILRTGSEWMEARQKYLDGDRAQWKVIWEYRKYSPKVALFEIMMPYLPEFVLRMIVWAGRKNII